MLGRRMSPETGTLFLLDCFCLEKSPYGKEKKRFRSQGFSLLLAIVLLPWSTAILCWGCLLSVKVHFEGKALANSKGGHPVLRINEGTYMQAFPPMQSSSMTSRHDWMTSCISFKWPGEAFSLLKEIYKFCVKQHGYHWHLVTYGELY